jgi:hypothetical protein
MLDIFPLDHQTLVMYICIVYTYILYLYVDISMFDSNV